MLGSKGFKVRTNQNAWVIQLIAKQQFVRVLVDNLPAVGWHLVNCHTTIDQQLRDDQPTVDRYIKSKSTYSLI